MRRLCVVKSARSIAMALVNCFECGHEVSTRAAACPSCGCPTTRQEAARTATNSSADRPVSGANVALAAMLCGIASVVLVFMPVVCLFAGLPAIFAVAMGGRTVWAHRQASGSGVGMALGGLVAGIIGCVLYALFWLMWQDLLRAAISGG